MCGLLSVVVDRSKVKVVDDTAIWKTIWIKPEKLKLVLDVWVVVGG
jgi:hypothetical protein